jgi:hypothetical protein
MEIYCNKCHSNNIVRKGKKKDGTKRYRCKDCGKQFDEKTAYRPQKIRYEEKGNNANIEGNISSRQTDRIKILSDFLKLCKVDLEVWEVDRFLLNAWDVTMKIGDFDARSVRKEIVDKETEDTKTFNIEYKASSKNHAETFTNYQIKVWLKKKTFVFDDKKFLKELIQDVKKYSPVILQKKYNSKNRDLAVFNLVDLHLGKLAWHEESGKNYDVKIATSLYNKAVDLLINRISNYNIREIWFVIGNDFFNYDYAFPFPQTTAGTPQESDIRWQNMFRVGRNLIIENLIKLSEISEVNAIVIPGNHDVQSSWYLGEVLDAKFYNNKNINVDNSPNDRKYKVFGKNLIGFAHGKHEKIQELHNQMASECKELWGITDYRYWYLGHKHHEKTIKHISTEDYRGVIIKSLPTLARVDKFEHSRGYTGSINSAKCYIHDFNNGLKCEITENL